MNNHNFSSFLDAPGPNNPHNTNTNNNNSNNHNMPRQAPSPSPSPTSPSVGHQNGLSAAGGMGGMPGQGANGIPMVNGLPSGGQQTDMNHLWTVVQQLSQVLEENRAQTFGIVNGVTALQQRDGEEGGPVGAREVNGEINAASQTAELAHMHTQLSTAHQQITTLTTSNTSLTTLITDYENALTLLLEKLRPYAYNSTQTNLALHAQYRELLEKERATSMQLRLEHAEWQKGLGRVMELARAALRSEVEGEVPYARENRELREENRVLRRLVGWEERKRGEGGEDGDSSDEEEEERRSIQ